MTADFAPTHEVPADGLPVWAEPDGRVEPVARLDPRLPVEFVRASGDWTLIRCSNDWTGWVDGRRLEPVAGPAPTAPPTGSPSGATAGAVPGTPIPADGGSVRSYADVYRRARPVGRSPASIAAAAASEAPSGRPPVTPVLIGAALVAVGAFLPWISFPNTPSRGSPSIPLQFLADIRTTADGPIDLVVPLLVAAAIGVGATVMPTWTKVRRIAGWSVVVVTSIFVGQLQRLLGDFGPGGPSLTDSVGIGVVATIAGGLVLGLAPDQTTDRPSGES